LNRPRVMLAMRTALFLLGVVAACAGFAWVADHTAARVDTTAAERHRLSPRARALAAGASEPIEIIAAFDGTARDRRLLDAIGDVLEAADAASTRIILTRVDTSSSRGRARFQAVIDRLIERDMARIRGLRDALDDAREQLRTLAEDVEALSEPLLRAGASKRAAPSLRQRAALARSLARELRTLAERDEELAIEVAERNIPDPTPRLDLFIGPLRTLEQRLASISEQTSRDADRLNDASLREAARTAAGLRDDAAVLRDRLERLETPDVARIAEALAQGEAIVVSRSRTTESGDRPTLAAIGPGALFPASPTSAADAIRQTRGRTESNLIGALAALTRSDRPIVVLTHAQWTNLAGRRGVGAALERRLARSGIDLLDWPAARGDAPPPTAKIDPEGVRPVVHVILPPDTWTQERRLTGGGEIPSGVERAERMAEVTERLIAEGASILLCLQPAVQPTYGDVDPLAALLEPFGLDADTSRAILTRRATAGGTVASAQLWLTPGGGGGHPIASAIRGLPVTLGPAVAIEALEPDRVEPLLVADDITDRWAESRWLGFVRAPAEQRPLIRPQPEPNVNDGNDGIGPWTMAAASQRVVPGGGDQRLIAVGASTWMLDAAWAARGEGGVLTHPGNIELLEASVTWLAGQDGLIAASPTARPIPLIRPLDEQALSGVRWGLIAGVPGLILLGGILYRVIAG